MLSRVADSVFWMSRYVERAENIARFIDVNIHVLLDLGLVGDSDARPYWQSLLDITHAGPLFAQHYPTIDAHNVCHFMTFNLHNPNSILSCVVRARENARSIRESIASEMWEQLNQTYWFVKAATARQLWDDGPHAFYTQVKQASHLFRGICEAMLPRGEGWHFIETAKYLERADNTSRLLESKCDLLLSTRYEMNDDLRSGSRYERLDVPAETVQWVAILKSCSAYEAYRRYYVDRVEPRKVVEFLLLNDTFARSVLHCIQGARFSLQAASNGAPYSDMMIAVPPAITPADRRLGRLHADLTYATVDEILRSGLREKIDAIQLELNKVGGEITQTYLHCVTLPAAREMALAHAAAAMAFQQQQQQQQQ